VIINEARRSVRDDEGSVRRWRRWRWVERGATLCNGPLAIAVALPTCARCCVCLVLFLFLLLFFVFAQTRRTALTHPSFSGVLVTLEMMMIWERKQRGA
jgi:hypothetical protein